MSLLDVKNLSIEYPSRHGDHAAGKTLSVNIQRGEIVGHVGVAGAGKSHRGKSATDFVYPHGGTV
ncbi:hypothetical protein JS83_25075 [Vibrio vulnificus]|nr:hypothetical protein JS83_25075 [Vibrio vulnificus]